jgi:hypothetical protein
MKEKFILTLILFNIVFSLYSSDTLLVGITDLGSPIRSIIQNNEGEVFVQIVGKVYKLNNGNLISTNLHISHDDELHFQEGRLTTINTLKKNNQPIIFKHNTFKYWNKYLAKVGSSNVCFYAKDNAGKYWVSNGSKFLYSFIVVNFFERKLHQLSIRGLMSIGEDLYVNSYSGVFKNDKKLNLDLDKGGSNLFLDKNRFLFASANKIYAYDYVKENSELVFDDILYNVTGEISCVFLFDDKFWIGSNNGLFHLSKEKKLISTSLKETVNNFRIIGNELFILSVKGVYKYRKGHFDKLIGLPVEIYYNDLLFFNNHYFLATSNGLLKYNILDRSFEKCFKNSSYENIEFFSMEMDDFNNLWIGSMTGLIKYKLNVGTFDLFLKDFEFNKRSNFKDGDNFYFGTTDGYIKFQASKFFNSEDMGSEPLKKNLTSSIYKYLFFLMFILSSIVFFYFRSKVKRLKQLDQEKSIPNQNIEEQIIENEGEAKYKMSQIENYIIENIEDINVDKLREDSGLSKNMFYRVFSRYYDITPKRLINQLKDERFRVKRKNQKNFHNRT